MAAILSVNKTVNTQPVLFKIFNTLGFESEVNSVIWMKTSVSIHTVQGEWPFDIRIKIIPYQKHINTANLHFIHVDWLLCTLSGCHKNRERVLYFVSLSPTGYFLNFIFQLKTIFWLPYPCTRLFIHIIAIIAFLYNYKYSTLLKSFLLHPVILLPWQTGCYKVRNKSPVFLKVHHVFPVPQYVRPA